MPSQEEIINLFDQLKRENQEIYMINVYKGFPITYPGTIQCVQHGSIRIKTNPFQIVCIYKDKKTYIRHNVFPYIVQAELMKIELSESSIILSRFEYIEGNIGDRRQVRVEPNEAIIGGIKVLEKNIHFKGEIADISLDGLALYLLPGIQTLKYLREGTRVRVQMELPTEKKTPVYEPIDIIPPQPIRQDRFSGIKKPLSSFDFAEDTFLNFPPIYTPHPRGKRDFIVEGHVANIFIDRQMQRHRVGIRLAAIGSVRATVSQFILQRQTVLLNEIRNQYALMTQEYMNKQ